jgi:excisionase family DNA binding protein
MSHTKEKSPASPPRRYGSLAEAAAVGKCHLRTIRRRIADGTIVGYRFGPHLIRVDLDEVERSMRPIPNARAS